MFKSKSSQWTFAIAILASVASEARSIAQESGGSQRAESAATKADAARPQAAQATTDPDSLPSQIEAARVPFRDLANNELVNLGLFPESKGSKLRRPGNYYHDPLLAFKENGHPVA